MTKGVTSRLRVKDSCQHLKIVLTDYLENISFWHNLITNLPKGYISCLTCYVNAYHNSVNGGILQLITEAQVQINKILSVKLYMNYNICFGCSKNCLIETVLLSTHN